MPIRMAQHLHRSVTMNKRIEAFLALYVVCSHLYQAFSQDKANILVNGLSLPKDVQEKALHESARLRRESLVDYLLYEYMDPERFPERSLEKFFLPKTHQLGRVILQQLIQKNKLADCAKKQNLEIKIIPPSPKDAEISSQNAGGLIYVLAREVLLAQNEDELAAVIAHELAHSTMAHLPREIQFSEEHSDTLDRESFHRKLEFEADYTGLQLMLGAGFDPTAAIDSLKSIEQFRKKFPPRAAFRNTHPAYEARTEQMQASCNTLKSFPKEQKKATKQLLDAQEEIRYYISYQERPNKEMFRGDYQPGQNSQLSVPRKTGSH
ncbi:MAG: M48 family metalloprotease [Deltaproteobacteria bacterium]|nr:M48 family metalloprotease [Deltaproteobacteria bacterium]